ncbi:MAG: glycosyltransferase [Roseovarius sp.]|nr:glycosyltransferase [Roseovarius sp.]
MNVLISAYACEPGAGSEPGAGWEWSRAAALQHDVWLLTRKNNGPAIEAAIQAEPGLRITPVYLDLPAPARFWKYWPGGTQLYYLIWQALVWRTTRELMRRTSFDVLHHLTFAVDWMPAGIAFAHAHTSFVWGPVGGATSTPLRAWQWFGMSGIVKEFVRSCATGSGRRMFGNPTARRAAVIVAQNDDVAARFDRLGEVRVEPNVVVEIDERSTDRRATTEKKAVLIGRLIYWKGIRLAIAAMAEPALTGWTLDVYGDGPDAARLERFARSCGVKNRVNFHGHVPRQRVQSALRDAHVLMHPSLHEAAGWVVAEGLAAGCGVVCLDIGGPSTIVRRASHGRLVEVAGHLPQRFAEAVAACPASQGDSRFGSDRLAPMIGELYDSAAGHRRLSEVER